MKEENDILHNIDQYLNGTMSAVEKAAFEAAMASDKALASQVEEASQTNEAILLANLSMLKEGMAQDLKTIQYQPKSRLKKYLLLSALMISGAGITTIVLNNTPTPQKEATSGQQSNNETIINKHQEERSSALDSTTNIPDDDSGNQIPSSKEVQSTVDQITNRKEDVNTHIATTDSVFPNNKTRPLEDTITSQKAPLATTERENNDQVVCDKVFIISPTASCTQQPTGSVVVFSDQEFSYTFEIDEFKTNTTGTFENIAAGTHTLVVTYSECTYQKTFEIVTKKCLQNPDSYSFNPDYGEKWELKYEEGDQGVMMIYNSVGKMLYESSFGSGDESWDGTDQNGMVLTTGIYQAIIKYDDGRVEKVKLTIIR